MHIDKVYTKTGDAGQTSIIGGERRKKNDARIEAYGCVDELNAFVGLLITYLNDTPTVSAMLSKVQSRLFDIGTALASTTPGSCSFDTSDVEKAIDEISSELPPLQSFIILGGSRRAALAHVCRTVCRRAERRVVALAAQEMVAPTVVAYLNRLSDYFFVLSRKLNFIDNTPEKTWVNTCR